jgi:general secretion pathway protein A
VYLNYFGLSEASFSITPDPQYLFLSEQHREALAHLLYGAGENGGFVMLTGEVGTGKTTICRAFLEQTPEHVDVALVLNPAMTAIELMHAICQEFGVVTPDNNDSVKVLVDRLNAFLLDEHARGRHPVLIIDEAQNLCPRVLEQVRLLTNLETSKQKLLQIFLIGQPELRDMLASAELRQLNQRITARFHLAPLSARETAAYVDHRLAVAGVERPLFTAQALREVHRRSRGVPRLINLICDRSLLGAAVSRRMQVSPDIVRRAAAELIGDKRPVRHSVRAPRLAATAAALVVALVLGGWFGASGLLGHMQGQIDRLQQMWIALQSDSDSERIADASAQNDPNGGSVGSATPGAEASADGDATDAQAAGDSANGAQLIADRSDGSDTGAPAESDATGTDAASASTGNIPRISLARVTSQAPEAGIGELPELTLATGDTIPALMQRWGYRPEGPVDCGGLSGFALACERSQERWSDLRLFDRPAALRLRIDGEERYALVTGLDDEFALLQRGDKRARVPIAALDERWSGDVLMLWRLPPSGMSMIGPGSTGEAVQWLRERMALLPDASLTDVTNPVYDAGLRAAVREFQSGRGLAADGIAGPRTLVMLNNALMDTEIPRLSQSEAP